jgi:hypothetical protein
VGSILVLVSVGFLRGPTAHMKHMMSKKRLPFTLSYVGSMVLTLYAALGVNIHELKLSILIVVFVNRSESLY